MKKQIFFLAFILSIQIVIGQNWQWAKQIGGPGVDQAFIGNVDAAQNVYIFGGYAKPYAATNYYDCYIDNDTLQGSNDAFIAKYGDAGNLLWVRNCVSPSGNIDFSFAFDINNNVFYIAGLYDISCNIDTCTLYSGYNNSGFFAKFNSTGHCLWAKNLTSPSLSSTYGHSLTIDDNGNIFIAGYSNSFNTIGSSTVSAGTFLAKFDNNGSPIWAKTKFPYTGNQSRMRFLSLRYFNNNIYAAGSAYAASSNDIISVDTISVTNLHGIGYGLICMDSNTSDAKWMKFEGFPQTSITFPMMDIDNSGNIYCGGSFHDSCIIQNDTLFTNNITNGFLSKYNPNGHLLFVKQFTSSLGVGVVGVSVSPLGSIVLTGACSGQSTFGSYNINASTSEDLFLAKFDNNGNCQGVDHADLGVGLSVAYDDNNIYVTGIFPPPPTISATLSIGNQNFTNYGWADIVFAKHDLITGISEGNHFDNSNELIIYANPNKGSFRLKIPEDFKFENELILSIFDFNGKLIRQKSLTVNESDQKLDIFGEASGIYNVTLTNGKKYYYGKMIVE